MDTKLNKGRNSIGNALPPKGKMENYLNNSISMTNTPQKELV